MIGAAGRLSLRGWIPQLCDRAARRDLAVEVRRFWIEIQGPIAQVQGGAEIMDYGGDIAELLPAAVSSPLGAPSAAHEPEMIRRGPATNP